MTNNRTLKERDQLNPDVALIRKTSTTNTERGWRYIKLLLAKTGIVNLELETWLNITYHKLEEKQVLELSDNRLISGALFYLGCIVKLDQSVHKKTIRYILRPLAQNSLDNAIRRLEELKIYD